MTMRMWQHASTPPPAATFLRLTWTVAGHLMAVLAAVQIVLDGGRGVGRADALLWVAMGAIGFARWVEVTQYDGRTRNGDSVTVDGFWRFVAVIALEAVVLWGLAHALGLALTS